MLIGAHVSAAGGLHLAPARAAEAGLECFQFFTRPPQGGPAAALGQKTTTEFREACARAGFGVYYVHAPYVVNLASPTARIRNNSVAVLSQEIRRADALGARALVTHVGSAAGIDRQKAVEAAAQGLTAIVSDYDGAAALLVEVTAGAGSVLGPTFEEIAALLELAGDPRLGVCLDTAHAFAAGYDLRTPSALAETLRRFDAVIGLSRLKLIHANDSQAALGARKDRHAHTGRGEIGLDGFRALVAAESLAEVDLVLETPLDGPGRAADISALKDLRDGRDQRLPL